MTASPALERLVPARTRILLIDVQERLATAMPESRMEDLIRAARILIEGGAELGAAIRATEQYPEGLGKTIAPLAEMLDRIGAPRYAKLHFSALGCEAIQKELSDGGGDPYVVFGIEAHVCVFQTVRDLCARGYRVVVPVDAVASRRDDHRAIGLSLCERAGAVLSTAETIAFDWIQRAKTPEFKSLARRVR